MSGTATLDLQPLSQYHVIMAKIPLFGKRGIGKFTQIDDEDVELVVGVRWHVSDTGYAVNRTNGKTTRMHRVINKTPHGLYTDHKNGNTLDNRKSNLRTVTHKENSNNMHGTLGYFWNTGKAKWQVTYKGKFYGRYATEEEAKQGALLAKSGVPKAEYLHPRRQLLPKGVLFMQPMAQLGRSPYYIRPQRNGVKYFKGYFSTVQEAEDAYNKFLAQED